MIKAKGKIKRAEREADRELEDTVVAPVRHSEGTKVKQQVSSKEIVNVMSDTFDRLLKEGGGPRYVEEKFREVNAQDFAIRVAKIIKYGIPQEPEFQNGGYSIRDESFDIPLCGDCE
jgi:predicted AAA+ superfamily ATPase